MKEKKHGKKEAFYWSVQNKAYDWLLKNEQESMLVSYKIFKSPTENSIDLLLFKVLIFLHISKLCSSGSF